MDRRMWNLLVVLGVMMINVAVELKADDAVPAAKTTVKEGDKPSQEKKEKPDQTDVPLPQLPEGAGKPDEGWPKTFTPSKKSKLEYRILRKGDGQPPKANQAVTVDYHGWTIGDDKKPKVFDSSYLRKRTSSFPLSKVIDGWKEGIQHVGKGGMIELVIPPEIGYGDDPPPGIPKNAVLHYVVELRDISDVKDEPQAIGPNE